MNDQTYLNQIPSLLLKWYDANARILPWREDPSPYRVWISEIMLQQTRVEAGKPYFEHFVSELPDVKSLAEVDDDHLLKLWEGLGYYNRAKNLKKAAVQVMEQYDGVLPNTYEQLLELPGIGSYTAGAIASIAYGVPRPAVDGNVLRVISRILARKEDITKQSVKQEMEQLLQGILPHDRVGDFNQSLMELGATVCLPNGTPHCEQCPVRTVCMGHKQGIADQLPIKTPKKKRKIDKRTIFLLQYGDRIALNKREKTGLLSDMWEFPNIEGNLTLKQSEKWLSEQGISWQQIFSAGKAKHIFSHIEWHMIGYFVLVPEPFGSFTWATEAERKEQYSLPSAFRHYIKALDEHTQLNLS